MTSEQSAVEAPLTRRAVLYLRVSSSGQVQTDYDPEGISIPAQREACKRKAEQMGVDVVAEYVEPGRSGRSMDQRPAFQAMLERIRSERDVDYVIVYKLSRMNRNRVDDAMVLTALRKYKVNLVSATENIDESPVGQLVHGILASINEFRSAEDGADIRYKMGAKAKRGGTLGRAPIGYMNVRERFEGREIRTVAVDQERAPLIKLGFELYATGEYTVEQLGDELVHRGLRTRPGKHPAKPLSRSQLHKILRDPYYTGVVTHEGVQYDGRHEAIVSTELYEQVQLILDTRARRGERERIHNHYLKGSLYCEHCKAQGRESRLVFTQVSGNGGKYHYFFCRAKRDHPCPLPYLDDLKVEDAVARYYQQVQFSPDFSEKVRNTLRQTLDENDRATTILRSQLAAQIAKLDRQEEGLIDLAADGEMDTAKVRARIRKLQQERKQLQDRLEVSDERLSVSVAMLEAALELLANPAELYLQSGPNERRLLNQAIFKKLYLDAVEVVDAELHEPFAELLEAQSFWKAHPDLERTTADFQDIQGSRAGILVEALFVGGSNKTTLVEVTGLEPATSTLRTSSSTGR